jgi:hypothetical protein
MQYVITLSACTSVESDRFAALVETEDASALVDRAPATDALRVSTCLMRHELQALASVAGLSINADAIELLPSDCCGGCGG